MSINNGYALTASYVANLTLNKALGQIEYSRQKVSEYLDYDDTDEVELLATYQVLDLYETIMRTLIRATYEVRSRGPMTPEKASALKELREKVDAFSKEIDEAFDCAGKRADFSAMRNKRH